MLFALLLAMVVLVSSRDWQIGDTGLVRWDYNCDFSGYDIGPRTSTSEKCGGECIANPQCTHFTWTGPNTCHLKKAHPGTEITNPGAVCGFVVGRTNQPSQPGPVHVTCVASANANAVVTEG